MDWDNCYKTGETPWDKGTAHPSLATAVDLPPDFSGRILAPGCGRGWDVKALAEAFPAAEVQGVDLSVIAIEGAAETCAGISNVSLKLADFLNPDALAENSVELLWEHTCFCALDPDRRPDYAAAAARLIVPGGALIGIFFLHMDDGGSGPPWNCGEEEFHLLFSPHFEIAAPQPVPATFPGRENEERIVRMTRRA